MRKKKLEKKLVLLLPRDLKARLDTVRNRGYTLNGYVRFVLAESLRGVKLPKRRAA
ncbi:MAG: hypothetical protein KF747_03460 [Nitrospira sp.]|nr:hypothetical protein [Nitrospira sp.]